MRRHEMFGKPQALNSVLFVSYWCGNIEAPKQGSSEIETLIDCRSLKGTPERTLSQTTTHTFALFQSSKGIFLDQRPSLEDPSGFTGLLLKNLLQGFGV